ncbi:hypothetical protein V1387_18000 [Allomuricauda taeanensis]|uniref:hypothetical protein n=1 Tax=Flagellimonas taeanensis TaxID=1005926 RepID=UPI002E7B754A|nr:hypothetical protein [Allomuricauda taeanensis]MEE1964586.1 hypothetical protein [Allomuricauda taeanensis]
MNAKNFNARNLKSRVAIGMLLLNITPIMAQQTDINGQIELWGDQITTVLNAVVGIFSIVGGFLIFIQYMQGNEQAQKNFIRFIIGLAIFGLITLIANIFLPQTSVPNQL